MIFFKDICLLVAIPKLCFFSAYVYSLKHYILILFSLGPAVTLLLLVYHFIIIPYIVIMNEQIG